MIDISGIVRRVLKGHGVRIDERTHAADLLNIKNALRRASDSEPIEQRATRLVAEFRERAKRKVKLLEELIALYQAECDRCMALMNENAPFTQQFWQWPDHVALMNSGKSRGLVATLDDLRVLLHEADRSAHHPSKRARGGKRTAPNVAGKRIADIPAKHGVGPHRCVKIVAEMLLALQTNEPATAQQHERLYRSLHESIKSPRRSGD